MIKEILAFLELCAKYDVAGWLSLFIMGIGALWGYVRFFKPRRSIRNFPVKIDWRRAEGMNWPLQITISFTNHTGKKAYISSVSFRPTGLRPAPHAAADTATQKQPIKFPVPVPGANYSMLEDFDVFLDVDRTTSTYAAIDPQHTDEEVMRAFTCGRVGVLDCFVCLLSREYKPEVHRLRVSPKARLLPEHPLTAYWRLLRGKRTG
jgi:hypothetical protein